MKRQVAYKQGYKIVIFGKFYEVWNKTIGIQLVEENYKVHRNNAYSRLRGKAIGA